MQPAFDDRGLIVAIAQDRRSGEVRMVGWMTAEALARTAETGLATFHSRSRGRLWVKGESSGNRLRVHEIWLDCDADSVLLLVEPEGPTCHTGRPTCFFRDSSGAETSEHGAPVLAALEHRIEARKLDSAERSYTRTLLDGGPALIGAKLREEADELARAVAQESDQRVAEEAADLLYHLCVALAGRSVPVNAVMSVLAARANTSGLVEKARRSGA